MMISLVTMKSPIGVLYINPRWEDNWGGETVIYDRENLNYCEISKFKSGKLIVFDGSNPILKKFTSKETAEKLDHSTCPV